MARYATTEELHQCPQCAVLFALRESKQIGNKPDEQPIHECPGCKDSYVAFVILQGKPHTMWGSKSVRFGKTNFDPDFILPRDPERPIQGL